METRRAKKMRKERQSLNPTPSIRRGTNCRRDELAHGVAGEQAQHEAPASHHARHARHCIAERPRGAAL